MNRVDLKLHLYHEIKIFSSFMWIASKYKFHKLTHDVMKPIVGTIYMFDLSIIEFDNPYVYVPNEILITLILFSYFLNFF